MGKRSNFERVERDFYPTPYEAVEPLLSHLPAIFKFAEPCCGDMALVQHLSKNGGACYWASDIERRTDDEKFIQADALDVVNLREFDFIITNPPWSRDILHPMIEHFRNQSPTWLLFDADWMHTKQAAPYLKYCGLIVSVGRVSWMGNGQSGMDNCCWYFFDKTEQHTQFIGKEPEAEGYRCKDTKDLFE